MSGVPGSHAAGALLADKVVVVSGAGPGLGRSIAVRAAGAGADVVLAARTEKNLATVADEVEMAGRRALPVPTDIDDDASAEALVAAATDHFGRVDALVHNAFAMPPLESLADTDLATVRSSFETNVMGALRLTRLFTPALRERRGSVVMINSAVLHHARPDFGAYKMAKSSLLALARSLSSELGPQGVRVNSVAPGYIYADALKWYFDYLAGERGTTHERVYDEAAATTDLRRLPVPDEIADAVVFLTSDMARAVTGQCLDVNAGEFHN